VDLAFVWVTTAGAARKELRPTSVRRKQSEEEGVSKVAARIKYRALECNRDDCHDRTQASHPLDPSEAADDGHKDTAMNHLVISRQSVAANLPLAGAKAEHVDAIAASAAAIKRLRNIVLVK